MIYIAAPWTHRETAREVAAAIEAVGQQVGARWLRDHEDSDDPERKRQEALHDLDDIAACELFMLLNLEKSEGKATELGFAYALGKPCMLVGPKTGNIFYNLPGIMQVKDVETLYAYLDQIELFTLGAPKTLRGSDL